MLFTYIGVYIHILSTPTLAIANVLHNGINIDSENSAANWGPSNFLPLGEIRLGWFKYRVGCWINIDKSDASLVLIKGWFAGWERHPSVQ